jgi:hypothetical protein
MKKSKKLNKIFLVGEVLVYDRFKHAENFPCIFKTHKVDSDFGVVYYKYKDIEDTIENCYVRRAKFWERIFLWIFN